MGDHAYQGVKTAVRMQMEQVELRKKWKAKEINGQILSVR